jgi:FKBP-type peptidyl-prolyl cis-trans isomerase
MMSARCAAVLVVALAAGGCGQDVFRRHAVAETGFAKELNVDTTEMKTTASGLRYQDLAVGTGAEAVAGRTVEVHYTGWLTNGEEFDSSRRNGTPYTYEGVAGMKVGGRRKLVVPPALGYGAASVGPIPPNSTLVFDVELVGVR